MGDLIDVLTRYAKLDITKDPRSDDDKSGKGKKNGGSRGHQHNTLGHNGNRGNQGNSGKCKHPKGGSDFVPNTNTGFKGQRRNNKSGRRYNGNKPHNFEEALKAPYPKQSLPDKPANHSWENCYIMQAFRNQA